MVIFRYFGRKIDADQLKQYCGLTRVWTLTGNGYCGTLLWFGPVCWWDWRGPVDWVVSSKLQRSELTCPNIPYSALMRFSVFSAWTRFCNRHILVAIQANASRRVCEKDCNTTREGSILSLQHHYPPRLTPLPTVHIHWIFPGKFSTVITIETAYFYAFSKPFIAHC